MNREYHKWFSGNLSQEMELLVFGEAGQRVLVFPTRAGRFFDYENWGMVGAVAERVCRGELQLFCVDSIDGQSFYNTSLSPRDRICRHLQYEDYLLNEVLPFTMHCNSAGGLITHGCSMGAFHALNFALRHPTLVDRVVALSGRYDLTRPMGDFRDLFDGYYDEDIYFHTPAHFVANLRDEEIIERMRRLHIQLAVGDHDPFLDSNRQIDSLLETIEVPRALHVWPGRAHKPRHWQVMTSQYL